MWNRRKVPYVLHGSLQTLAFLILLPAGMLVAIFRDRIGPSWLPLHMGLQLSGTLCVVAAMAIVTQSQPNSENDEQPTTSTKRAHHMLGWTVATLLAMQWLWVLGGRSLIAASIMTWTWWYRIHVALATTILTLGFAQVGIGIASSRSKN